MQFKWTWFIIYTKPIYIKLEDESRNKTIHSTLFSPHNPFAGNYSNPFNDFIGRVQEPMVQLTYFKFVGTDFQFVQIEQDRN